MCIALLDVRSVDGFRVSGTLFTLTVSNTVN